MLASRACPSLPQIAEPPDRRTARPRGPPALMPDWPAPNAAATAGGTPVPTTRKPAVAGGRRGLPRHDDRPDQTLVLRLAGSPRPSLAQPGLSACAQESLGLATGQDG